MYSALINDFELRGEQHRARSKATPTTAALLGLIAVTAATSCGEPQRNVVGLIFPPPGVGGRETERQVKSLVYQLASERFREPVDTVDGMVYAVADDPTALGDTANRFLLVLPYGDREHSAVMNTAAIYVLTLRPPMVSRKYLIPLAPGQEVHVQRFADVDEDGVPDAVVCLLDNAGQSSVLALAVERGELRAREHTVFGPEVCPPGEALP